MCVYTWERFRLFQYDHVQELQIPGEIYATGIAEKKVQINTCNKSNINLIGN